MTEPANGHGVPGVYVANLVVSIGYAQVSVPAGYCDTQSEAKQLAQEIAAQAQSMLGNPVAKQVLHFLGVGGLGTSVRVIPRHSPIELPPPTPFSSLIVGKS